MVGEVGGDMLFSKVTRSHTPRMVSFNLGLYSTPPRGSLLICDNVLLEQLQLTITRAVADGTFHRCGVVLVIDEETLHSEEPQLKDAVHLGKYDRHSKAVERWTPSRQRRQFSDGRSRRHCAED